MGRLFGNYMQDEQERAVACVNALQGVPQDIVNSHWFKLAVKELVNGKLHRGVVKAYREIQSAAQASEAGEMSARLYEQRLRHKGRAAGLRAAMRFLNETPQIKELNEHNTRYA